MSRHRFEDAACAGLPVDEMDRVFFSTNPVLIDRAKRICDECPIRAACLEAALSDERGQAADMRFGVFAGTTPTERVRLDPGRVCADCGVRLVKNRISRCAECYPVWRRSRHERSKRVAA